jgi:CRP/FNR family transcriptional regulator, cyclic AMP receptor protein
VSDLRAVPSSPPERDGPATDAARVPDSTSARLAEVRLVRDRCVRLRRTQREFAELVAANSERLRATCVLVDARLREVRRCALERAATHERVRRDIRPAPAPAPPPPLRLLERRQLQAPAGVVHLLQADPDLGATLSHEDRLRAGPLLRAAVLELPPGAWDVPERASHAAFGFLVLDGLLQRRVDHGLGVSRELLGPGDVVGPHAATTPLSLIPQDAEWTVVNAARLALIDERLTARLVRWPALMVELSQRQHHRAWCLAHLLAISHLPRVEDRLLATLWYVAQRWGHVTPAGTTVPLTLTHQALGEMVGAQRPSISLAVRLLQEQGRLARVADQTYLLLGAAPGES